MGAGGGGRINSSNTQPGQGPPIRHDDLRPSWAWHRDLPRWAACPLLTALALSDGAPLLYSDTPTPPTASAVSSPLCLQTLRQPAAPPWTRPVVQRPWSAVH